MKSNKNGQYQKCGNCKSLSHSCDVRPAMPLGGSKDDMRHICPNDGNMWLQYSIGFHLWKHVTDLKEWESTHSKPY
ncbi:MAG: hypothetical protein WCO84_05060 [bacterium]